MLKNTLLLQLSYVELLIETGYPHLVLFLKKPTLHTKCPTYVWLTEEETIWPSQNGGTGGGHFLFETINHFLNYVTQL